MYLNKRKEKSMKKISVVLIAALVVSLLLMWKERRCERYRENNFERLVLGRTRSAGI